HGGSVDGFRAHVVLAPKQKVGVVVLANLGHTQMPPALCYALLDRVLELPQKNWNSIWREQEKREADAERRRDEAWKAQRQTGTMPSRELDVYAGEYVHPAYGKAIIRRSGEGLALEWSSFKETLGHFHYDTFIVSGKDRLGDEPITFTLGSDGDVSRLRFLG